MLKHILALVSSVSLAAGPVPVASVWGNTTEMIPSEPRVVEVIENVWITAYTSSPEETDSTPYTTAYLTQVREGIVATNMLPFGTKIRIPEVFGERVFTVEDKMHRRKQNFVDIWMPDKQMAKEFGINSATIVVLEG